MKSLKSTMTLAGILLGALALGGCSTNSVVANVAKAAFEDRLAEEQITDVKIQAGIADRLISIDKMLLVDLNVDVWKTRVMVTGALSSAKLRNQVAGAVQQDGRISYYYNEAVIVSEDEQAQRREWKEKAQAGAQKAAEVFDDVWVETKISAQLITAKGINSVNYRWRSVLGVVYILGEAQTAQEWKDVQSIIKGIEGVKSLKSHVLVRG